MLKSDYWSVTTEPYSSLTGEKCLWGWRHGPVFFKNTTNVQCNVNYAYSTFRYQILLRQTSIKKKNQQLKLELGQNFNIFPFVSLHVKTWLVYRTDWLAISHNDIWPIIKAGTKIKHFGNKGNDWLYMRLNCNLGMLKVKQMNQMCSSEARICGLYGVKKCKLN